MIQAARTDLAEIAPLRERFRAEAACQIVRDSILPRGLADAWAIRHGAETVGYAGVWNHHFPGRLMEFYVVPEVRDRTPEAFAAVRAASGAGAMEAQTNLPAMHALLVDHIAHPRVENLLFGDGAESRLVRPDLHVRPRTPDDVGPEGDQVVELRGEVVGAGGLLHHYNPPYADLYMEVMPHARGRGVASFLVQELRRLCREAGGIPAARCDPGNEASRRALIRGGLVPVGELVAGRLEGRAG